jgi:hypothetical protein
MVVHMSICRQAQLISTIALIAIGCERPPNETAGSSPPVVVPTVEAPPAALDTTGSFAYVDSSGRQMLALDSLPDPSAAFTWAGAEGESSELLLADSAGVFRTLTMGFRYWSPL